MGLLGWIIEICWTALPKRRPVDWTLTGHTYLWMLPIYALIGPLYYRRWFSREPIDDGVVDGVINGVMAGLRLPSK